MSGSGGASGRTEAEGEADPGQQPHVPRPPSPAELDEISRDQALITDEWGGEGPPASSPERPSR